MFIRLDKTPERVGRKDGQTDGGTDGQNWSDYYSGRHCEQCGRAGKTSRSGILSPDEFLTVIVLL